eukprot:3792806-Rhodomonas_salina.1
MVLLRPSMVAMHPFLEAEQPFMVLLQPCMEAALPLLGADVVGAAVLLREGDGDAGRAAGA